MLDKGKESGSNYKTLRILELNKAYPNLIAYYNMSGDAVIFQERFTFELVLLCTRIVSVKFGCATTEPDKESNISVLEE